MSFDLLKEHLQAVAKRLDDKTDKKTIRVITTSVKKSHSKNKTDRAVNYIGSAFF